MSDALILANFADVEIEENSIDLIFTDPPYKRAQAMPCYDLLAMRAPKLLKPGGSLVTIVPHYFLEHFMETMWGKLKYRWIYSMDQEDGPHPRMAMGIEVCWKPMLHYVKGSYPQGRGFIRDKVPIPGPEKDMHDWQQAEIWADYYVPRLCPPDGVVLDPFVGTGTVPHIARLHNRTWIGVDNDPAMITAAKHRLGWL